MRKNTYVYRFEGKLYLNITNKCSNNCDFCIRNGRDGLEGNTLWLSKEPTFDDMVKAFAEWDLSEFSEIVFCGFGEPTENLEVLKQTAAYLKNNGYKTRLNTNGQGSLVHGRDIVPELVGLIDVVSVSLNSSNAYGYQTICRSAYGEIAYEEMLKFTRSCAKHLPRVVMSVVDDGDEMENKRCEQICLSCGAEFRLRTKY